jgi:acyl-CoA reductase-like NAD-dependent aldehyde dehydrogenase
MNDTDKARFQRALDLVEWLDVRIGQRLEQQLEQRFAQEREYWRCHVTDLIVAERERLVALAEEEHRKVIDCVKAGHKKAADLVEWNHEQSKRLIAEVAEGFDRIQAKLDQYATPGVRRPDDDGQPPPSTH